MQSTVFNNAESNTSMNGVSLDKLQNYRKDIGGYNWLQAEMSNVILFQKNLKHNNNNNNN